MVNPGYDKYVQEALARLDASRRLMFALGCFERLFPAYIVFTTTFSIGDSRALRALSDRLWNLPTINGLSQADADEMQRIIKRHAPNLEQHPDWYAELGLHACLSLSHSVMVALNDSRDAALDAGATAYDSANFIALQEILGERDSVELTPEVDLQIERHPASELEWSYQKQDLADLDAMKQVVADDVDRYRRARQAQSILDYPGA